MTEHFENLWEQAEKISESFYDGKEWEIYDIIAELQENLVFLRIADKNKDKISFFNLLGKMLFNITFISKKYNINTYSVLKEHMEDIKIEMLDTDLDNSID